MKPESRSFLAAFLGAFAGIVLCLGGLIGFGVYVYQQQMAAFDSSDLDMSGMLAPPDLGGADSEGPSADWELTRLDGSTVAFGDLGSKVTLLNIWATWCGPCRAEMPSIQKLYESMGEEVNIACVSDEDLPTVKAFIEEQGFTFPVYVSASGIPGGMDAEGIPATYILNTRGEVVFSNVGSADWNHESVREYLHALISGVPVSAPGDVDTTASL